MIISNFLIAFLLVQYIIIAIVCAVEGNLARTLYWVGATLIQTGVMLGMK